ncbi:MAG: hypothetical protein M0Z50_10730 [Planctomycetia bacterium]|jgi:hypothetical protein|nr:hypothetical protein [Planctomycetia bacterium]
MATGYAGGGVFNGNANREVITVPFLSCEKHVRVAEICTTSYTNYRLAMLALIINTVIFSAATPQL